MGLRASFKAETFFLDSPARRNDTKASCPGSSTRHRTGCDGDGRRARKRYRAGRVEQNGTSSWSSGPGSSTQCHVTDLIGGSLLLLMSNLLLLMSNLRRKVRPCFLTHTLTHTLFPSPFFPVLSLPWPGIELLRPPRIGSSAGHTGPVSGGDPSRTLRFNQTPKSCDLYRGLPTRVGFALEPMLRGVFPRRQFCFAAPKQPLISSIPKRTSDYHISCQRKGQAGRMQGMNERMKEGWMDGWMDG